MVRRRNPRRNRRRPAQNSRQVFIENMRIKIPTASTLSITRDVVELSKDRSLTLVKIKAELTGTIGSTANAGALICQIRLLGLEQTIGFKWTSGPFMVSSGNFTTRIFNIPRRYQYVMPRNVPGTFVILSIDHICADSTLDNTSIHGLLHLSFNISQEQVVETCPTQYLYVRNRSPILVSTPANHHPSTSAAYDGSPEASLNSSFHKLSLTSITHEAPF